MMQFKGGLSGLLLGLILLNGVAGRKVNTTIHDTNTAHITYAPQEDFCVRWIKYLFWRRCEGWAKPWEPVVYRSQGKLATLHRSLDHEQPTMTIKFQGSSIWLYGPPRSQLPATPVDHKICLYENHRVASDIVCYRVDVAEAYSVAEDHDAPVVIFAKGGLQDQEHQLVVSIGDPVDEVDKHRGVQFSHAVYTIERPTPWPTDEDSWRFREVVVHDTHPLLSYWPKEPVSAGLWPWSPDPSGWLSKTGLAEDGSRVSWHELRSRGESNQDKWGIDITVTAGVVALYGVPKAYIAEIDSLSNVCVQVDSGPCDIVDVKHAYLRIEDHHEAVLLWRNQSLDPYQQTRISIRLVKMGGNNLKVFPFQAIHYFEQQEYSSPDPPVGQLEDVAVTHDDQAIVYHPGRRCLNYVAWWCAQWFDPWAWKEAGPSGSILTYRSTVASYRAAEDPSITLDFQGSAVYVYGAPKSFMKDGFAPQHICINNVCHIVDVEQAYLNAPEAHVELANAHPLLTLDTSNLTTLSAIHPELEPVLIWSMTGLDDKIQHSLRLALAELPSPDSAEMSIAKVMYTKVTYEPGQSRPDTPVPPDHTDEGPLYPPHAVEWAPRLPSPHPAQPHHPSPPNDGPSRFPYVLWPVLGTLVFFSICVFLVMSHDSTENPERRPIRPRTPPPPYVPGPPPRPRPVRPNPRPVRPNPPRPNPPPYRPNPPPAPPKSAPPPTQPAQRYPNPNPSPAGPSSSHPDPNHRSNRPIPKSVSNDENNAGPCPGFNVASPKPEYTDIVRKQPPVSSQKPPHSSIKTPVQAQSATVHSLSSARATTGPVSDQRSNHSTSQTVSSAITPTQNRSGPTVHNTASSSRVQTDSATRQPPAIVHPVPLPPQASHTSQNASATQARNRSDDAARRPERAGQSTSSKATPSTQTNPQAVLNPLQPPVIPQNGQSSTTTTHRPQGPPPKPQESAYTPALTQWAESQGYRIDRLINPAARNENARTRTGAQRSQAQGRSAMPPFDPAAHDTLGQGSTDWRAWRRSVEETGRVPSTNAQPNQGAASRNRREQRREPEGNQGMASVGNNAGVNPDGNRTRAEGTRAGRGAAGGEAPAAVGAGARRPRASNQRPNQAMNNKRQR
ncbi:hypothetical protein ACGC1H_003580 [Rhizoctonia solani]|uniref:Transmembrane protein n=1 Tax=Rhizoctonia solani TaxID=456999 RepID=A0A8H3AUL4_9AGAM|nr:unnamed protein product [Rhizoctonia solani]